MNNKFEEAYKLLNPRQREAVDLIEGPVLVIAGPGTGKTQLLSTRVANIIKSTDAKPANILCLTFTNKAAINMKERIIAMAGHEGAKVAAKTFHSFAAEIMNSYPDYFWNAASLSIAPESVQLDIIESIVKELPLDNPLALKFAGQYTLLSDIQRSINLAKDAGLTPDKLRGLVEVNLAYLNEIEARLTEILTPRLSYKNLGSLRNSIEALPKQEIDQWVYPLTSLSTVMIDSLDRAIAGDEGSGKCLNTGAWKKRWVQTVNGQSGMFAERKKNDWWLELSSVYEKYRQAIHLRGFYDYADMLVEVVAQLEQNPDMLADIQERFTYVLIDEFQDTNAAQLRLAHLVASHHSAEGKPNLMVVGDDDQSIFKFSGADLNNMMGFARAYTGTKTIVLTDNYRSTQTVLDSAKKIIGQAETRLVTSDKTLDKNLVAVSPPEEKGEVQALSYSSRELQLSSIGRHIKENYNPDRTIAVLARGHDSLIRMTGILQTLDVPVRYEQQSNVLDHEIINQVYLIISLLGAIQAGDKMAADALTHQIIRHPAWGAEPRELWRLALGKKEAGGWLDSLLASPSAQLKSMGNWFIHLSSTAASQPLAITIEQIVGLQDTGDYTSPLREYFVDRSAADTNKYFHSLSAIQLLRALVHEFAAGSEPTLEDFARFIEINKTNGRVVADESPFITGTHAVQLLSVHKAKGLEFDSVYIIDAIEDNWRPRNGGRKPPANLPLQPVGDDADDYVRLMYVAATRVESSLTISGYYRDHAGNDVAMSPIIQSAFDIKQVDEDDKQKLITVLEENLRWPSLSGGVEREMLKARLETYSLSVTNLLNFLDVTRGGPEYFKERNLLRLPEAKTASMSYGTAMHSALEAAQRLTNKDSFDLEAAKAAFSKALGGEQLSLADTKRFDAKGRQTLERLFQDLGYKLPKGSLPEQKLKDIKLENVLIKGDLDRVDVEGTSLKIIDYKTGAPLSSFYSKDKNKELKAYRHKTQLIFYALLAHEHPSFSAYSDVEGQMIYVEADRPAELSLAYKPTPEDIAHLGKLVEAVWQRIQTLDFPDISAYEPTLSGIRAFEADLLK
ncbi:MAG: uvrD [Candidatus Saccharibacteria bacterium]|nr:uvrD [Candidatus Saccharibacteria bacterium]